MNITKKQQDLEKELFDKFYEDYFCYQQSEDSPYLYNDVRIAHKMAFREGIKFAKEEILKEIDDIKICATYSILDVSRKDMEMGEALFNDWRKAFLKELKDKIK